MNTDAPDSQTPTERELVLVLHGLGNSHKIMSALSWYLERRGLAVLNISYPSCQYSTRHLASLINARLRAEHKKSEYKSVSIVGFSLGSQIARLLIEENSDKISFSRLVMLGPPNQGASIARFLKKMVPTEKLWGPVFDELCCHDLPNPASKVELGIIAGALGNRVGINPFLGEDNDGLVKVSETFLEGAKERKILFAPHGIMPFQLNVMRLTARFIQTGSFIESPP